MPVWPVVVVVVVVLVVDVPDLVVPPSVVLVAAPGEPGSGAMLSCGIVTGHESPKQMLR